MKYGGSESVCKNCPAYFTVAYPLEVALNLNRVDSATVCGAIFFGIIPPAKIVLATAGSWITWCGDGGEALLLEQALKNKPELKLKQRAAPKLGNTPRYRSTPLPRPPGF